VQRLIVDVGGVGYQVQVPLSTFMPSAKPARPCRCASTRTREDALRLRVRLGARARDVERLIGVSGIDLKVARSVLSESSLPISSARSVSRISHGSPAFPVSDARPPSASSSTCAIGCED
jgi:Holliday junction resolvasome RuvABC DNA-binding subunit